MESVSGFYLVRISFSYLLADINHTIVNGYIYRLTESKYPNINVLEIRDMLSKQFNLSFNMTVNNKERDSANTFHKSIRDVFRKVVREKYTTIEEIPVVFFHVSDSSTFPQPWR